MRQMASNCDISLNEACVCTSSHIYTQMTCVFFKNPKKRQNHSNRNVINILFKRSFIVRDFHTFSFKIHISNADIHIFLLMRAYSVRDIL